MTTKMISEETLQPQAQEETLITPRDLRRVFWRSFQMEFSWNYERQMNLAFVYALIPVLKKLYPRREELAAALKRHLVFFNTTPHIVTLLLGITTAMEEKNSHQKNMDATAIDNVKASLMGPLAGLGDSFFWGTLRLIATGIGTSLALKGNILGPILFLLVFNVPHILVRGAGEAKTQVQDIINDILPCMLPLVSFGIVYWLLGRKVKPLSIIGGMALVGILGSWIGLF
ncbi:MAG: PTS system mannose/fructose/sorbose family transporter subunit IID [Klebsiella pneumoniae]|nr:PTS system mannose/fructose/sorbose family transporter subunit IID [Klebsiella pneumoniae]